MVRIVIFSYDGCDVTRLIDREFNRRRFNIDEMNLFNISTEPGLQETSINSDPIYPFLMMDSIMRDFKSQQTKNRNYKEDLSWIKIDDDDDYEEEKELHIEKKYPFPFSICNSFIQIPNIPASSSQTRNFNEELGWIKECIVN